MSTYSITRRGLALVGLLVLPLLAGCNTTAGFGRDVASTGRFITDGAQTTHDWMFGAPAQAAENSAPVEDMAPAAGANVVFFASGSAALRPEALDIIHTVAAGTPRSGTRIEVAGYADTAGPAAYNERLSQHRAEAVASVLAAQGVPRNLIAVRWYGETQPVLPTPDGVAAAENRRVSITGPSG